MDSQSREVNGNTTPKPYPVITGLSWHRHQYYSFFAPIDWHRFVRSDDHEGEIYGPDPNDPSTVFSVTLQPLDTSITADDLDVLAEGFYEAIEQLPEARITSRDQRVVGKLLELEAKYTFQEQGATHKCWVRVFYHETRQIAMMAQGATPEKYDYWQPLFFEAMMTARIHDQKPDTAFVD